MRVQELALLQPSAGVVTNMTSPLDCLVCFERFTRGERRPMSLQCGHSMCRLCISQLSEPDCPLCRQAFATSVINHTVCDMIDAAADTPEALQVGATSGAFTRCEQRMEHLVRFEHAFRNFRHCPSHVDLLGNVWATLVLVTSTRLPADS